MNSTRGRAMITVFVNAVLFGASLLTVQLGNAEQNITLLQLSFIVLGSTFLWLMTCWTLYFKRVGWSLLWIGFFPSVCLIPLALFAYNVLPGFLSGLEGITFSVVVATIFGFYAYLLVLTANVLNGALLFNIPLGQAGKAAQFVFGLISTYLLGVLIFGINLNPLVRVAGVVFFTGYIAYSAIWGLQQYKLRYVRLLATSIALVMGLFTLLLSIWPLAGVYGSVILASIFYMSLNVALEVRELIKNALWIEYWLILSAILIAMLLLGEWGINGSLL